MTLFSQKEKIDLINFAHQTLETYVETRKIPPLPQTLPEAFQKKAALFVRLYSHEELRGKAGVFEEKEPLCLVLQNMVIQAGTGDPNNLPIQRGEVKSIQIEIIYIYDFKPVTDMADVQLGHHGLYLTVENKTGYLFPEIATQHKWNVGEFLGMLGQKAGLPSNAWQFKNAKVWTFQTQTISDVLLHQPQTGTQRNG
ncbi:MAG: hypothetical protein A3B70_03075 [Deltaproteobacteria bacterium RIFCSPHIGHO2_02_FULL_40_11]|nr:MAG: hypothetical protein A3B70_03075 [Deltaproteobacteria bacterium RIFCSPHIGHO2_02_FULL_40_11]